MVQNCSIVLQNASYPFPPLTKTDGKRDFLVLNLFSSYLGGLKKCIFVHTNCSASSQNLCQYKAKETFLTLTGLEARQKTIHEEFIRFISSTFHTEEPMNTGFEMAGLLASLSDIK